MQELNFIFFSVGLQKLNNKWTPRILFLENLYTEKPNPTADLSRSAEGAYCIDTFDGAYVVAATFAECCDESSLIYAYETEHQAFYSLAELRTIARAVDNGL